MSGPMMGILGKAVGAMLAQQIGSGLGALAARGPAASPTSGCPLAAPGRAALRARQRRRVRRGPRRHRGRRAALPRAARGRPPAALRPRAVAARAPDRRGGRLRPRHRDQRRGHPEPIEEQMRGLDPTNPEAMQGLLEGGLFDMPKSPRAGGRAASGSRSRSRWSRAGSTRSSARPPRPGCRPRPSCRRRSAAAGPPAAPPSRPSPRSSGSSCARAGCATPPRCGARCAPARAPRRATACGCTPTCCRPPPTSTTRSASARTRPRPSELSDDDFDAALRELLDGPVRPMAVRRPGRSDPAVSLHADALAALGAWTAPDAAQESLRERYVAHLEAHPDGLERACFPDHLTAGTLVIDATGRAGAAQPAPQGAALVRASAATASPATPPWPAPRCARRVEESGLTDLGLRPGPGAPRRARGGLLRPARRRSTTSTSGSSRGRPRDVRPRGQRGVPRRALVPPRRPARARAGDARR